MVLFATFRILDIISFTAGSLGNLHCVVSPVTGSCVTNRDTPVLFPPAILASPVNGLRGNNGCSILSGLFIALILGLLPLLATLFIAPAIAPPTAPLLPLLAKPPPIPATIFAAGPPPNR